MNMRAGLVDAGPSTSSGRIKIVASFGVHTGR